MVTKILNTCSTCGKKFRAPWQDGICPSCKLIGFLTNPQNSWGDNLIRTRRKKSEITQTLNKEKLGELYITQGKSLEDIANEYGCSRQAIMNRMKKYGLIRRGKSKARIEAMKKGKFERFGYYEINENYFSEWSSGMAWVLGLLFTDGNLSKGRVAITSVDIELLEKIKKLLNSSYPIVKRTQSYDKSKHIYEFGFSREKMTTDLDGLKLSERKSLYMKFPNIPEEYMRHFIRGCWDGDGSVYIAGGRMEASYVSGSEKFVERLVQELYRAEIYISGRKRRRLNKESEEYKLWSKYPNGRFPLTIHKDWTAKNAYYIKIQTKEKVEKLFHYFYDGVDESVYLARKYNVFVKGLNLARKEETEQLTLDLDF